MGWNTEWVLFNNRKIRNYSVATRELMKKGLPIKAFLIALKADKPCLRAVPM